MGFPVLSISKPKRASSNASAFRHDERGQVIIMFSLLFIPLLGFMATAIDMGRAYHARQVLQSAVDSAAMAGAQQLGQPHNQIGETVVAFLKTNLPPRLGNKLIHDVVIGENDEFITVRMNDRVETSLAKIIGFKQFDIKAEATINRPKPAMAAVPEEEPSKVKAPTRDDATRAPSPEQIRQAKEQVRRLLEQSAQQANEEQVREIMRMLQGG